MAGAFHRKRLTRLLREVKSQQKRTDIAVSYHGTRQYGSGRGVVDAPVVGSHLDGHSTGAECGVQIIEAGPVVLGCFVWLG
jgi:hypothetical protein